MAQWLKCLPVQEEGPRLVFPDPSECQVGVAACLLFQLQKTDSEFPQNIQRDEPQNNRVEKQDNSNIHLRPPHVCTCKHAYMHIHVKYTNM